jgi:hypothetical protein
MERKPYSTQEHSLYLVNFQDRQFDISEGITDAGFAIAYDNDAVSFEESPKGFTQFHIRKIRKAVVEVTLDWGSISNTRLNQAFLEQEQGNRLKNCLVKRVSSTENITVYSGIGTVLIQKPADSSLGAVAGPRVWRIHVDQLVNEERTDIPA